MSYVPDSSLPDLIAQITALGITYGPASWAEGDPEAERSAAGEFMYETDHLREIIEDMVFMDDLAKIDAVTFGKTFWSVFLAVAAAAVIVLRACVTVTRV